MLKTGLLTREEFQYHLQAESNEKHLPSPRAGSQSMLIIYRITRISTKVFNYIIQGIVFNL